MVEYNSSRETEDEKKRRFRKAKTKIGKPQRFVVSLCCFPSGTSIKVEAAGGVYIDGGRHSGVFGRSNITLTAVLIGYM